MPKRYGTVVVSGGDFAKKPLPSHTILFGDDAGFFNASPKDYVIKNISYVELPNRYAVAFLVECSNSTDVYLFFSFSTLWNFVRQTSNKQFYADERIAELERVYGRSKKKLEWKPIGDIEGDSFYEAVYVFGGILRKHYGMKSGDNYQNYFKKIFMFEKVSDSLITEMTQVYVDKCREQWSSKHKNVTSSIFTDTKEKKQNRKVITVHLPSENKKPTISEIFEPREVVTKPKKISVPITEDGIPFPLFMNALTVNVHGCYDGSWKLVHYDGKLKNYTTTKMVGRNVVISDPSWIKPKYLPVCVDEKWHIIYIAESNFIKREEYLKSKEIEIQ